MLDLNWNTKFKVKRLKNLDGCLIKLIQRKRSFCKFGELKGSSYIKTLMRSNTSLTIKNNEKYCFIWSVSASLHTCDNDHPIRV